MKNIFTKLAVVWGSGILGLFMLYLITGGVIDGVNIGAGKVFVVILCGVIYGTYKVLSDNGKK
jgi:hypothetical protein|tara:strand:+ start:205 stop:393 length:189 start_codon:yes stop_codon:yes gene_type:complete